MLAQERHARLYPTCLENEADGNKFEVPIYPTLSKYLENYTFSRVLELEDYEKFKVPDTAQMHFNYNLNEVIES